MKKILVLGGFGYLGWPTAMKFASEGHMVTIVDNLNKLEISRKIGKKPLVDKQPFLNLNTFNILKGVNIEYRYGDVSEYASISNIIRDIKPDTIIHYAEQPSGPYSLISQKEGEFTLMNNLKTTHNILWSMVNYARDAHLIKLGTAGEYGESNVDIPEGWLEYEYKGRKDKRLFPRQAGSLYHTTKVLDTDLIWFFVRMFDLRVTDLMQGPVYGIHTNEIRHYKNSEYDLTPYFWYDDVFGTVVNRFLVQAVVGIPLTVYGKGGQTRGYLNIKDTLQCIGLVLDNVPEKGVLDIYNQITETLSVNQIANRVKYAAEDYGLKVDIQHIDNPRKEKEEHYYKMETDKYEKLGLKPHLMSNEVLVEIIEYIDKHKKNIDKSSVFPSVTWHK